MQFTASVTDLATHPDASPTSPSKDCKCDNSIEEAKQQSFNAEEDQEIARGDSRPSKEGNATELEGASEEKVVETLRFPLPPTEIYDGLLFRKVG